MRVGIGSRTRDARNRQLPAGLYEGLATLTCRPRRWRTTDEGQASMPELRQGRNRIGEAHLVIEQNTAEICQSRQVAIENDARRLDRGELRACLAIALV